MALPGPSTFPGSSTFPGIPFVFGGITSPGAFDKTTPAEFTIFKDNLLPLPDHIITYQDIPIDLTGASVKLQMRPVGSPVLKVDATATIINPVEGHVTYTWAADDVDTVGDYDAWWRVTFAGKDQDTPEFIVRIIEHAPLSSAVPNPVTPDGSGSTIIFKGDSYLNSFNRALTYQLQVQDAPDLTGFTIRFRIKDKLEKTMTLEGEDAVRVDLTSAETTTIGVGVFAFEIEAEVSAGNYVTLLRSTITVNEDWAPL